MGSNDDPFADLFQNFKSVNNNSSTTQKSNEKDSLKQNIDNKQTILQPVKKNPIPTFKSNSNSSVNLSNDLDDLFGFNATTSSSLNKSTSPISLSTQGNNKYETDDDLLMSGFEELRIQQSQKEEARKNNNQSILPNRTPNDTPSRTRRTGTNIEARVNYKNRFETANDDGDDDSNWDFATSGLDLNNRNNQQRSNNSSLFSLTSQLFDQGKKFVETQFAFDSSDRMGDSQSMNRNVSSPRLNNKVNSFESFSGIRDNNYSDAPVKKESILIQDNSLLSFDDEEVKTRKTTSQSKIQPENVLLDINDSITNNSSKIYSTSNTTFSIPNNVVNKLSSFESDSYYEFKDQATNAFKLGDFHTATEKFKLASQSIPQNHIFQVVIYRNLLTTMIKIGDVEEMGNILNLVFKLLPSDNFKQWSGYEFKERQMFTLKNLYKKILLCQCDYYEMKENLSEALNIYKKLIHLGFSDTAIIKEKQRLDKMVNPVKKIVPKKPTPSLSSSSLNKNTVEVKKQQQHNLNIQKQIQNEDTIIEIKKQVNKNIEQWCNGKPEDLRHLLSTLHQIISDWQQIDLQNLISPKKCKIYYFKAINKTHPDKIPQTTPKDKQILYETVFMVLNKAWETFKVENQL
ncbi:hypothetical protein HANVADRAFT_2682 [Hanseniaspora valbyensis NRRL Y-1626]|uniref:J domain-containing protein n=1 Tax=Hanseniaspora valbyensis NRRL Y-1626 TaxID=766949 RepID=A0A1B7TCV2_9ASCO|nr:hypothetical protein HANVADRAFT_2682 [Hanseniaspora valbyensis NRRL Y-1626]